MHAEDVTTVTASHRARCKLIYKKISGTRMLCQNPLIILKYLMLKFTFKFNCVRGMQMEVRRKWPCLLKRSTLFLLLQICARGHRQHYISRLQSANNIRFTI